MQTHTGIIFQKVIMDRRRYSRKPELLAPAGDYARAVTAIRYGADAVYLGGQHYSLRSRASNFSMEQIHDICAYAEEHHARIHVTVNEIPHEEDLEGLEDYLKTLEAYGVTAIICASPSVIALAKKCAPGLEVHASTQLSTTNSAAVSLLKQQLDIDRIVLARECTLKETKALIQNSPVDVEVFIHGGMCVNYSGRCTLSNRMTLRDANRGGCAQSCRWSYALYEDDREVSKDHPFCTMGSRDLCAASILPDLMEAGAASLKIEGRMKTEYYVASIVSAYRHLIDELYENDGPLSRERMDYHIHEIMKGENRETCTGFYEGTAGVESIIAHENNNDHVNHGFLATVKDYDKENGLALIETRNPFCVHDSFEVMEPGVNNRIFELEWMKKEDGTYLDRSKTPMAMLWIPVPFEVKKDDILRSADT